MTRKEFDEMNRLEQRRARKQAQVILRRVRDWGRIVRIREYDSMKVCDMNATYTAREANAAWREVEREVKYACGVIRVPRKAKT